MTGEQFLNSIRYLDCEINALDRSRVQMMNLRQDILDRAENLGVCLSGVCVQQGLSNRTETLGIELASIPTAESLVNKLNEYQALINGKIDLLVDRKREAIQVIDRVPDPRLRSLLLYRYIDGMKWSMIACLMGYTEEYVRTDVKQDALAAFEGKYEMIDTEC